MPTITAGRPADADEIRSYADIVAAHRALCRKAADHKGEIHIYKEGAARVARLGQLYQQPAAITDEIRATAQTVLAAVHTGLRTPSDHPWHRLPFAVADAWLDHLALLINARTDDR